MSLTGLPLLSLSGLLTVATAALLVWLWRRAWIAARVGGVLLLEALVVFTIGLEVNRSQQFYPSWQALAGDTGTTSVTKQVHAGLLDEHLPPGPFRWRPPGLAAWHLAGPPLVTLPADYRDRPRVEFPVVLALGTRAPRTDNAVTVTITPTARTTAAELLRTLPSDLRHDLRVSAVGWDVLGGRALGAAFAAGAPAGLAQRDRPIGDLPPALAAPLRLPTS